MNNFRKDQLIQELGLQPLEREGGFFSFITQFGDGAGTIYYMVTEDSFSHLHMLTTDEIWYFLEGDRIEQILVSPDGIVSRQYLDENHRVLNAPKGFFQASRIAKVVKGYSLVSTVMSPAYRDDMYTHGADVQWVREIKEIQEVL